MNNLYCRKVQCVCVCIYILHKRYTLRSQTLPSKEKRENSLHRFRCGKLGSSANLSKWIRISSATNQNSRKRFTRLQQKEMNNKKKIAPDNGCEVGEANMNLISTCLCILNPHSLSILSIACSHVANINALELCVCVCVFRMSEGFSFERYRIWLQLFAQFIQDINGAIEKNCFLLHFLYLCFLILLEIACANSSSFMFVDFPFFVWLYVSGLRLDSVSVYFISLFMCTPLYDSYNFPSFCFVLSPISYVFRFAAQYTEYKCENWIYTNNEHICHFGKLYSDLCSHSQLDYRERALPLYTIQEKKK